MSKYYNLNKIYSAGWPKSSLLSRFHTLNFIIYFHTEKCDLNADLGHMSFKIVVYDTCDSHDQLLMVEVCSAASSLFQVK